MRGEVRGTVQEKGNMKKHSREEEWKVRGNDGNNRRGLSKTKRGKRRICRTEGKCRRRKEDREDDKK